MINPRFIRDDPHSPFQQHRHQQQKHPTLIPMSSFGLRPPYPQTWVATRALQMQADEWEEYYFIPLAARAQWLFSLSCCCGQLSLTAPERLDFGIEGAKFWEVDEDGLDDYEFIGGERERERWEEPTT